MKTVNDYYFETSQHFNKNDELTYTLIFQSNPIFNV